MIYASEADIIPFLRGIAEGLQPYARSNQVSISFSSRTKRQVLYYQPVLLSQAVTQLICNIINLLPPKSKIKLRLLNDPVDQHIWIEIENTSFNLIRVNEICVKGTYLFTATGLPNGTLYRLSLPLNHFIAAGHQETTVTSPSTNFPLFYKEIQKRFQTHFTQADKLIASLAQSQPQEAAFMQKINTLIKINLENESFDTNSLCDAMLMSRTQLFRRLKSLIRQAPANYIKLMRLQKAKELLETTDYTVSEIAFKTGFQAISHFTKIFKKQYGILPSVFRRSNQTATNE